MIQEDSKNKRKKGLREKLTTVKPKNEKRFERFRAFKNHKQSLQSKQQIILINMLVRSWLIRKILCSYRILILKNIVLYKIHNNGYVKVSKFFRESAGFYGVLKASGLF